MSRIFCRILKAGVSGWWFHIFGRFHPTDSGGMICSEMFRPSLWHIPTWEFHNGKTHISPFGQKNGDGKLPMSICTGGVVFSFGHGDFPLPCLHIAPQGIWLGFNSSTCSILFEVMGWSHKLGIVTDRGWQLAGTGFNSSRIWKRAGPLHLEHFGG